MDNMLGKIYNIIYITVYPLNGLAILIYLLGSGDKVSITFPLIVFGIATFVVFLMGRLVQERFDNTLQMYLIIVSIVYLITAFIGPYQFKYMVWEILSAIVIFSAAFFLDGIFESE